MSKTPKTPSVPAPQFVIFDPPLEGYEARAEVRKANKGEYFWGHENGPQIQALHNGRVTHLVLTPVKRIEDLLPPLKCEAWASQDANGEWSIIDAIPEKLGNKWNGVGVYLATKQFNPFGLPVEPNPNWRDTLYHFQVGQGWRKCEAGK